MNLTQRDRHELKRLLGYLQTHLESAIESSLTPDGKTMNDDDAANVEADRKDWIAAERWVRRLEGRYFPNAKISAPGTANANAPGMFADTLPTFASDVRYMDHPDNCTCGLCGPGRRTVISGPWPKPQTTPEVK